MSPITVGQDVRAYLAEVERNLDDLPADERRELLEDLEQHLAEVAAEDEGSLSDRLGPPDAYAAELRASAGLPAREDGSQETTFAAIRRRVSVWLYHAPVRSFRSLLGELRPGWWVLRGYLGVLAVDAVLFTYGIDHLVSPIPSFAGSQTIGLAAVVVAVFVSIQLGRRSREPLFRVISVAANIAGAITFFAAVVAYGGSSYAGPVEYEAAVPGFLVHGDGSPISNVCAYDSKLRPLKNVLLYDQSGRPIVDTAPVEWGGQSLAGSELERNIGNAYPRKQLTIDPATGELHPFSCPTLDEPKGADDERPAAAAPDPKRAE
jgi:hypothetical protein